MGDCVVLFARAGDDGVSVMLWLGAGGGGKIELQRRHIELQRRHGGGGGGGQLGKVGDDDDGFERPLKSPV